MLVVTNPANKPNIAKAFAKNPEWQRYYNIVYDSHIPPTEKKETGKILDIPEDRFVEYELSDLHWLLGLGIAKKEVVEEMLMYIIDNTEFNSMDKFLYSSVFPKKG